MTSPSGVHSLLVGHLPSKPEMPVRILNLPTVEALNRVVTVHVACLVQIILQNTHMIQFETHPFHLHGYSFYIVGRGTGNYDPETSPATFNLVNPPLRNTFGVPHRGWLALRFRADNPGALFSLVSEIELPIR